MPELITVSLISHLSEVMLQIILKIAQFPSEEILAEEQAAFRVGRSKILCEKYFQHLHKWYNVIID